MAPAYDFPVIGLEARHVSSIRLWSAKATTDFNLAYFNSGNYIEAVKEKSETETHFQGSLPERHDQHGARAAAEAGIFPGQRIAPGHPCALSNEIFLAGSTSPTRSRSS